MKVTITCMFARVTVELDAQDTMDLMLRAVQKAAPGLPYDQGVDIRAMEPPEEETKEDTAECPRGGGQHGTRNNNAACYSEESEAENV